MEKGKTDAFVKIIILQCVLAVLIIATVLMTKYFFKGTYRELKNWYQENIAVDTDIYEVLGDSNEV